MEKPNSTDVKAGSGHSDKDKKEEDKAQLNADNDNEQSGSGNNRPETATAPTSSASSVVYPDPTNPYKCISNGLPMTWNETSHQWLPDVDVNEDFLALYHASYGVQYDYSKMPMPKTQTSNMADNVDDELQTHPPAGTDQEKKKLSKEEKMARRREAEKRQEGWVEMDEQRSTTVYVNGFPPSLTEEQFIEFMSKCGVIMKDPRTGKPKIKLYRTETGEPKGDGTCCYVKMESIDLALQILDGWAWDSAHKIQVEIAKFEMKGEFDPAKKKRRLTGAQKKRFFEKQQRIFEWKPDKPRNYRPNCECTLVLRGMFSLEEIDHKAERIFTLKEETQTLCERFGPVKKVVVYDTNPDGVVTVNFDSAEHTDSAIQALNGRIVAGRTIRANNWDGKEKFKRAETAEERARRESAWEEFLGHEEEEEGEREEEKKEGGKGSKFDGEEDKLKKEEDD